MNRIPVLNDEQRAGYGAPTTVVGATADIVEAAVLRAVLAPAPAKKAAPKKKAAAKAKAKK